MEAMLALEDGRTFRGRSFGARGERHGEVVFNTSMTGYQEVPIDPSYRGQIVVMTYPESGNYGTNPLDHESAAPPVEGFVVRELPVWPSNWRATLGLGQYRREHRTLGIADVDTRALTRHIRSRGAMRGVLSSVDLEGFVSVEARLMAVPYHPESSPGPHESHGLFHEFRGLVRGGAAPRREPPGRPAGHTGGAAPVSKGPEDGS